MTILKTWYASAPTDDYAIDSIEISVPGKTPIRICNGFEDHHLGINGVLRHFEAGSLSVSLPARNTTGQQTLRFAVAGVNSIAQRHVDDALAAGQMVTMTYRMYLASDKLNPADRPLVMTVVGGTFEGGEAVFECSYYDLLNTAWPRERYTAQTAPGIKYL